MRVRNEQNKEKLVITLFANQSDIQKVFRGNSKRKLKQLYFKVIAAYYIIYRSSYENPGLTKYFFDMMNRRLVRTINHLLSNSCIKTPSHFVGSVSISRIDTMSLPWFIAPAKAARIHFLSGESFLLNAEAQAAIYGLVDEYQRTHNIPLRAKAEALERFEVIYEREEKEYIEYLFHGIRNAVVKEGVYFSIKKVLIEEICEVARSIRTGNSRCGPYNWVSGMGCGPHYQDMLSDTAYLMDIYNIVRKNLDHTGQYMWSTFLYKYLSSIRSLFFPLRWDIQDKSCFITKDKMLGVGHESDLTYLLSECFASHVNQNIPVASHVRTAACEDSDHVQADTALPIHLEGREMRQRYQVVDSCVTGT
jgi:hypothetical protein